MQLAVVDGVAEHGAVGAGVLVQAGAGVDVFVGVAGGAQLEGQAHEGGGGGIGLPAVEGVGVAVAAGADRVGDGLVAGGGHPGGAAVGGDVAGHAAADLTREVFQVLLVFPIDHGFEHAADGAIGDVVDEGVDGEAAAAQVGFVELGVVEIAGEAGVGPQQQAGLGGAVAEVVDHGIEGGAADGGSAGDGLVLEDAGQGVVVTGGPGLELGFLLGDGLVLQAAAGIAQVGDQGGAGGEGGIVGHIQR